MMPKLKSGYSTNDDKLIFPTEKLKKYVAFYKDVSKLVFTNFFKVALLKHRFYSNKKEEICQRRIGKGDPHMS